MPRKPKPRATDEPVFTATQVGQLIAATVKAMAVPVHQPVPDEPEPTEGE